jgi:hypothetical protein
MDNDSAIVAQRFQHAGYTVLVLGAAVTAATAFLAPGLTLLPAAVLFGWFQVGGL